MKNTIKDIINDVLSGLESVKIPNTPEARALVFETGMAESGYRHLKQMSATEEYGAVSFWQIEPGTIIDIWQNYISYRDPLVSKAKELGFIEDDMVFSVMTNIAVAIFFSRIYYRRKPGAIPKTMEERANYWKEFYNTAQGKGTVKHYVEANK